MRGSELWNLAACRPGSKYRRLKRKQKEGRGKKSLGEVCLKMQMPRHLDKIGMTNSLRWRSLLFLERRLHDDRDSDPFVSRPRNQRRWI